MQRAAARPAPALPPPSTSPTVDGTLPSPATNYLGQSLKNPYHAADNNLGALAAGSLASVGGSQAHLNMQPFLVLNFSIALQGIFPSQT